MCLLDSWPKIKETTEDNVEHVEVNQMITSVYDYKRFWITKPSTCNRMLMFGSVERLPFCKCT